MDPNERNPLLAPAALAAAMLSLSIGWGIRGNFGHEAGAMVPGALCALAVCLFSGREDWRARAPYFAMFGALGWAFGGSIAYMPPLGYTHSGHWPTQVYGFWGMFVMGFLWAGMGGAGTAYAAVEEREKLRGICKPLAWVFTFWAVQYIWQDDLIAWYERAHGAAASGTGDFRQRDPFYWLDSEWIEATLALIALCLFDLWQRRFRGVARLLFYAGAGGVAGWGVQRGLEAIGWLKPLLSLVVHPQGDTSLFEAHRLVSNWPQVFFDLGGHMGWIIGLVIGAGLYFRRYGEWRPGASLLMHITLGSMIAFLVGPVLLSNVFKDVGGFRLMPPRGDSWANVLGSFIGMAIYMRKNRLAAVAGAAAVAGVVGGLGLMTAQFVKLLAYMPGNPVITADAEAVKWWSHWHRTNWHSLVTEQGVGLFYGLGIALALATVVRRAPLRTDEAASRHWTEVFAVAFTLNVVVYLNLVKSVETWIRTGAMPAVMRPPLFGPVAFPASVWFNALAVLCAAAMMWLLTRDLRRPLALMPATAVGRGQLLYVALLWVMVIGNFGRALVQFQEARLVTEWVIAVNAVVATILVAGYAHEGRGAAVSVDDGQGRMVKRVLVWGVVAMVLLAAGGTSVMQSVYGSQHDGWGRRNIRIGAEADWRVKPILLDEAHR